jgi:hypothetical protein
MGDNLLFDIDSQSLLLINTLNTMYNDNIRQIENLHRTNDEIRSTLTALLFNSSRNANINRSGNVNRRPNYNRNTDVNRNADVNRRAYVNRRTNVNNMYETPETLRTTGLQTENDTLLRIFESFLTPVTIYPTPTQVELATRRVRFCEIIEPINNSCPISLDVFNENDTVTVIRYCGHIFNTSQINAWFRANCRCPICRYDIRNYHSASYNNTTLPATSTNLSHADVSANLIDPVTDAFLNEFINSNLSIPTSVYGDDASSNFLIYTYTNNT